MAARSAFRSAKYAGKAYEEAKKTRRFEQESRRAYVAATDPPGVVNHSGGQVTDLIIMFKNYGANPIDKGNAIVQIWSDNFRRRHDYIQADIINPVPPTGDMNFHLKEINKGRDLVKHIRVDVRYYDPVLNRWYTKPFYWTVSDDYKLYEPFPGAYDRLKKMEPPKSK